MSIEQRTEGLVKLTGTIENYRVTRVAASFVFTDTDRTKLGVTAIAAGIAGLSGPAIATAANAASAEEDADYVEFTSTGNRSKAGSGAAHLKKAMPWKWQWNGVTTTTRRQALPGPLTESYSAIDLIRQAARLRL